MEDRLSVLKRTFSEIVDLKEGNINGLKTLDTKIQQIKSLYSDFIQSNKDQLFVFSLDAFHFQSKLVDLEYEDMKRMFLFITNRMYCDYYKLFKIIVSYVNENIPDKKLVDLIKLHDNFPVYKDLEPFRQYDFQYIQSLHEIILVIITYIHTFITNKEHDLKGYQTKNQIGLYIDSFVSTFSFNTVIINQRALLYIDYIEFFHKTHTKYLKRFIMKLNLMLSQLNNDIKLDNPTEKQMVKKDMIQDLKQHNLDKGLMKELRFSISDEISTSGEDSRSKSNSGSSDDQYDAHQPEVISDLSDDADQKNLSKDSPKFTPSKNFNEAVSNITLEVREQEQEQEPLTKNAVSDILCDKNLRSPVCSPFVQEPLDFLQEPSENFLGSPIEYQEEDQEQEQEQEQDQEQEQEEEQDQEEDQMESMENIRI